MAENARFPECGYVFQRGVKRGQKCTSAGKYEGKCCKHKPESKSEHQLDERLKDLVSDTPKDLPGAPAASVPGSLKELPKELPKVEPPKTPTPAPDMSEPNQVTIKTSPKAKPQPQPQPETKAPVAEEAVSNYVVNIDLDDNDDPDTVVEKLFKQNGINEYFVGSIKGKNCDVEVKEDKVKVKLGVKHMGKLKVDRKKLKDGKISISKRYQ